MKRDASLPSPWGQAYPRAVRLAPDGMFVPCRTLRVLSGRSGRLEALATGFTLEPWVRNGDPLLLDFHRPAARGDLALCEVEGWGDIRRILLRRPDGTCVTSLDAVPRRRESLPASRVLATVMERRGSGGRIGRAIALLFPAWSRWAAFRYWLRKIAESPGFQQDAAESVKRKYAAQIDDYTRMLLYPLGGEIRGLLRRTFPARGSILVAGAGAGAEMLDLARDGYRVTGFDYLPEMVRAARDNAMAAGVEIEVECADLAELDLAGRTFDGIYITPLVYSFVPGRGRRVEGLRRLGLHLVPGGSLIYSAAMRSRPIRRLEAALAWIRHFHARRQREYGDWFTWFLKPDGTLGKSFTHLFTAPAVVDEAREAGFRRCRRSGAYFIADEFSVPGSGSSVAR